MTDDRFERVAQPVCGAVLALCAVLAVWAVLIAAGYLPAMPWSPLAHHVGYPARQVVPADLRRQAHHDLLHAQRLLERLWYARGTHTPAHTPATTGLNA